MWYNSPTFRYIDKVTAFINTLASNGYDPDSAKVIVTWSGNFYVIYKKL